MGKIHLSKLQTPVTYIQNPGRSWIVLAPDRDFLDTWSKLDPPTRPDHDREPASTDWFLGPTGVVTGDSIEYHKTQTDPTEESTNVGQSRVGYRFWLDRNPLLYVTQTTRSSAVWGYWNYLLECLEVRAKWNMSKAKILRAKKHLTDLFGEELKNLP